MITGMAIGDGQPLSNDIALRLTMGVLPSANFTKISVFHHEKHHGK